MFSARGGWRAAKQIPPDGRRDAIAERELAGDGPRGGLLLQCGASVDGVVSDDAEADPASHSGLALGAGRPRFDDPDDPVRLEIATALARDISVIPVLVDGACMPKADELPAPLKTLVRRHAVEVRNTQFGRDAGALVE
jgi:hypothetical protein